MTDASVGTAAAVALYITWKEIIPRLSKNGRYNGSDPRMIQQIAIFEEIRNHMVRTNEALAVLLERTK